MSLSLPDAVSLYKALITVRELELCTQGDTGHNPIGTGAALASATLN